MAVIETKFSVGDKVWHANTTTERRQQPCPDCKGEREWKAVSPAGYEYTFTCPRCSKSFTSFDDLSLNYEAHIPYVILLTIGSIRHDSHEGFSGDREHNTYMCVETGVGGGTVYYESNLFLTEEEAMIAAQARADINNATMPHIVARYNKTLDISDYQLESALLKNANEEASKARRILWGLNDLFSQIEEADDKDAILEAVEEYKRWSWQGDKDAASATGEATPSGNGGEG